MVLPHLLHTPIISYQDQWAEEVPSRAPRAAPEGCSSMQTVPRGSFQKRVRTTREVNLTPCTRTISSRGEFPSLHPHVAFRRQVPEAARAEDRARTTPT